MQPTYIPWLGYFDMIDSVDIFVLLDNVQLAKRSWQVRNRIKSPNGELYLTIPVKKDKGRRETLLNNALVNDEENWRANHIKSIEHNYRKQFQKFPELRHLLYELVNFNSQILAEINTNIIQQISRLVGIKTRFIRASELGNSDKTKDSLLLEICEKLNCSEYLSPQGSAVYIDAETPGGVFTGSKCELFYHHYAHPEYQQIQTGPFLPYMSIIDLLLCSGPVSALEIIRRGRRPKIHYKDFAGAGNAT